MKLFAELVQCLDRLDKDVLSGWGVGISNRLDGRLVVSKDGAFGAPVAYMSRSSCSANTNPLSSAAYTVEVSDVLMY